MRLSEAIPFLSIMATSVNVHTISDATISVSHTDEDDTEVDGVPFSPENGHIATHTDTVVSPIAGSHALNQKSRLLSDDSLNDNSETGPPLPPFPPLPTPLSNEHVATSELIPPSLIDEHEAPCKLSPTIFSTENVSCRPPVRLPSGGDHGVTVSESYHGATVSESLPRSPYSEDPDDPDNDQLPISPYCNDDVMTNEPLPMVHASEDLKLHMTPQERRAHLPMHRGTYLQR